MQGRVHILNGQMVVGKPPRQISIREGISFELDYPGRQTAGVVKGAKVLWANGHQMDLGKLAGMSIVVLDGGELDPSEQVVLYGQAVKLYRDVTSKES